MSNTENKTDSVQETPVTDTAPYMTKKEDKPQSSSKSNFIIPAILLIVSAIVIVATFYEDEYHNLMAEIDTPKTEVSANVGISTTATIDMATSSDTGTTQLESTNTAVSTTAAATPDEVAPMVDNSEITTNSASPVAVDTEDNVAFANDAIPAAEVSNTAATEAVTASATDVLNTNSEQSNLVRPVQQPSKNAITAPILMANNASQSHAAYSPYQQNHYQQAQMHQEMIEQRRQAYATEMQARQQQYEAMMQARNEKRTQIYEAQKAISQRIQDNRAEIFQNIQKLHAQIEELHNELHQLMQQSRAAYRPAAAVQSEPQAVEHI